MSRTEKDNISIKHEVEEIKVITDEVMRAKVNMNLAVFATSLFVFVLYIMC